MERMLRDRTACPTFGVIRFGISLLTYLSRRMTGLSIPILRNGQGEVKLLHVRESRRYKENTRGCLQTITISPFDLHRNVGV